MREVADARRVERFMEALGREARSPSRVYFTGGTSAVLMGWRPTTIDIDLKLVPDSDEILRAIPHFKNQLSVNVELASPDLFIPELWVGGTVVASSGRFVRSPFCTTTFTLRHFRS